MYHESYETEMKRRETLQQGQTDCHKSMEPVAGSSSIDTRSAQQKFDDYLKFKAQQAQDFSLTDGETVRRQSIDYDD